ncbi:MAG: methionyl-tRNA formyltransferase [Burkholderiales bacterium]|nr:methionyl-tRNA formyltransferase [Burkholderiales bacterium]
MKLIFAGTPHFAAAALDALIQAGHEIVLVLTQPDRPAGRGMKLVASPVKQLALQHGLPIYQPERLRTPEQQAPVAAIEADAMIVAAYGIILPQAVLDMPRLGCLNIHASLLPRWRGAAPIQRAIQSGDAETGITIMQMDAGLDTGDMLTRHALSIRPDHTAASLHDDLAVLGAQAIVEALVDLPARQQARTPQPVEGVTYAEKIRKDEAPIDWQQPAETIARALRAFDPFPGCVAYWQGETLKCWAGWAEAGRAEPGEIVSVGVDGVVVGTGDGLLRLTELQRPGARRMVVRDFLAGTKLESGGRFTPQS